MTIVLSLLFLGVGSALIVNAIMIPSSSVQEFPRQGASPIRARRILPMTVGAIIALVGLTMVLLSTAESQ